ncbi:MAG: glycosyltransferase family 2 protein [Nitrospirae bacterium YQR-1]
MKLISILTPCLNEEENVWELYTQVKGIFDTLPDYTYEHIFIDNASTDGTVGELKKIAESDKRVKVIVNTRNFGSSRSCFHGIMQTTGDAVIILVADLQDPPEMILQFIKKWEEGYKMVIGVMTERRESRIMVFIRNCYYKLLALISETRLYNSFTGFGLYDRTVIEILRQMDDHIPYFRGMVAETGFEPAVIEYIHRKRERGKSKENIFALINIALSGITAHSKLPLRITTFLGIFGATGSLVVALFYFVYKLLYWNSFSVGIAPVVIGLFLFMSIQLILIGIIGEYVGWIYMQVRKRPLVVERQRINF